VVVRYEGVKVWYMSLHDGRTRGCTSARTMAAACVMKGIKGAYTRQKRILCEEFSVDSWRRSNQKCVMHHRVLYLHHPASLCENEKATSSLDCCASREQVGWRQLCPNSCHTKPNSTLSQPSFASSSIAQRHTCKIRAK
jgi:hypothetical protein